MEKEEAVNELYALRAGLSAISQEYDKAQAIENACDEKLMQNANEFCGDLVCYDHSNRYTNEVYYPELKNIQARYDYIENYRTKIENGEIKSDETVEATKSWVTHIEKNELKGKKAYSRWLASDESDAYFQGILEGKQRIKDNVSDGWYDDHSAKYKQNAKKDLILSIVFFVLAVISLTFAISLSVSFNVQTGMMVFYLLFPSAFLICGIVFLCMSISNKKSHKREIMKAENKIYKATDMLDKLPEVREKARAILKEKDDKIAPIKQSCSDFYTALQMRFNPILDERDWQHLDLVIFELETRRADTVKEALQLVDRELQTERIQQTIAQATEQICYEIRRGFAELKSTIIELGRVISAQLNAVNLQLGEISGQLADLTDGVNLNNALLAKSNVTSSQLLSDVHAIRYYQ